MAKASKLKPSHINCALCSAQAFPLADTMSVKWSKETVLQGYQCPCGHVTFTPRQS